VASALAILFAARQDLELRLTNNHYSMISVRRKSDGYRPAAATGCSRAAEPRVVRALARYVVHTTVGASTLLGEYIEQNQHIIRQQPRRTRSSTCARRVATTTCRPSTTG